MKATITISSEGIRDLRAAPSANVLDTLCDIADITLSELGIEADWVDEHTTHGAFGSTWYAIAHAYISGEPHDVGATYSIDAIGHVTAAIISITPAYLD